MFLQAMSIPLFMTGVPLFLLLTGYLNANKTVSKRYYKGCIRVLASYFLFSLLTILFRKYYLQEDLTWAKWILKIFDFSAIPYAWYIEMWIGLFLLTPFLNMLYKAIPTRWQKQILILTLYAMTALPDLLNRYGLHLVPGFWASCYPLTFFFAGSYIHEYKPRFESWKLWIVILLLCLINPVLIHCSYIIIRLFKLREARGVYLERLLLWHFFCCFIRPISNYRYCVKV